MRRRLGIVGTAAISTAIAACVAAPIAPAAPGDLDTSFGTNGETIIDVNGSDYAGGLTLRSDGDLVASTASSGKVGLIAVTPNGLLDPSFGAGGRALFNVGPPVTSTVPVLSQPNSRLLFATTVGTAPHSGDFAVAQVGASGALDPAFGNGGFQVVDSGADDSFVGDLAATPTGAFRIAGSTAKHGTGGIPPNFAVAGVDATGQPDSSFGIGAFSYADLGGADDGQALVVQPDGKIVEVGTSDANIGVTRLKPDGFFDPNFAGGGHEVLDLGGADYASDAAQLPDGKLLIAAETDAGPNPDNIALLRLNADGSVDPTFGVGGLKIIDFGGNEGATVLAVQADGKILIAFAAANAYQTGIARVNSDGSPDTSFAGGGFTHVERGTQIPGIGGIVQTQDGDIYVGYTSYQGVNVPNLAVARFKGDGTPPLPTPEPQPEPTPEPTPASATCGGKQANVIGTDGNDKLKGTKDDDVIAALGGNDKVKGGKGDDLICLGDGKDRASGGPGDDRIKGGPGKDTCVGGPGDDHASCETERGI